MLPPHSGLKSLFCVPAFRNGLLSCALQNRVRVLCQGHLLESASSLPPLWCKRKPGSLTMHNSTTDLLDLVLLHKLVKGAEQVVQEHYHLHSRDILRNERSTHVAHNSKLAFSVGCLPFRACRRPLFVSGASSGIGMPFASLSKELYPDVVSSCAMPVCRNSKHRV